MFYLKINDKLREYIKKIPDMHFGCEDFCKLQVIAIDELELLKKRLKSIDINFTKEDYEQLINSTTKIYLKNQHICQKPSELKNNIDDINNKDITLNLQYNKDNKPIKNPFFNDKKFDENYQLKIKQEKDKNQSNNKKDSTSSVADGINLLLCFFIIVIGSFYFGRSILGLKPESNFKLVLVVTIVVFISETCLLMIKLNREHSDYTERNHLIKDSFAYRFNNKYRNSVDNQYNYRINIKSKKE